MIKLKRAYEAATGEDGLRILVDRLWPRGVTKERAALDRWAKELSPSVELCKWFSHDPAKWEEFQQRYEAELASHEEDLRRLAGEAREGSVTFVFGAKDERHNNALVLKAVVERLTS